MKILKLEKYIPPQPVPPVTPPLTISNPAKWNFDQRLTAYLPDNLDTYFEIYLNNLSLRIVS